MSNQEPVSPEVEARLREIVRDEQQKNQIQANAVAEQLETMNAILAVLARNHESMFRRERNNEPPTSYSYNWSRFGSDLADAIHTFEEELDR